MARDIRMSRLCILITLAVLLTSCSPWRFTLQRDTGWPVEGKIYDAKEHVRVGGDDLVTISSPASVALRCEQLTDGTFNSFVQLNGERMTMRFRSTPYNDTVRMTEDHVDLIIERGLVTVVTPNDTSRVACPLPPDNESFNVRVVQFGRHMDIEVACTSIGRFTFSNATTQWVSVLPGEGATVVLQDPKFAPIRDEFPKEKDQ